MTIPSSTIEQLGIGSSVSDRQRRALDVWRHAAQAGLDRVLAIRAAQPNANSGQDYDKLFVAGHPAGIRSVEVWYPAKESPYLKVTHGENIPVPWKERIDSTGTALAAEGLSYSSRRTHTSFKGDYRRCMALLAKALRTAQVHANEPQPAARAKLSKVQASPALSHTSGPNQSVPRSRQADVPLMSHADVLSDLQAINADILAFAERQGDEELLAWTRSYCTPFRSTLFGKTMQHEVAFELSRRRVDVLILGANPNDRADKGGDIRFGTLAEQIESGYFGEAYFDQERRARPGWSPASDPKIGWKRVLRSIEAAGMDPEAVAMANFLPWGSADLVGFAQRWEPALRQRMLKLAGELLEKAVSLLRPRAIVAVRSLSRAPILRESLIARHQARAREHVVSVPTLRGTTKSVKLYAGPSELGPAPPWIVHVPHPGYLQLTRAAEPRFERAVTDLLRECAA